MENTINKQAKVTDFITPMKQWTIANLNKILYDHITDKIKTIHVPITDVEDKLITHDEYSMKIGTSVNNILFVLTLKQNFINNSWKLNQTPKLKPLRRNLQLTLS